MCDKVCTVDEKWFNMTKDGEIHCLVQLDTYAVEEADEMLAEAKVAPSWQ